MSLHEKLLEAWGDAEAYSALHHEDWQMKMHSSGSTVSLSDMTERWDMVFKNADIQNTRKVYENEDILVKSFNIEDVRKMMKEKKIINGLTLIALQWFFLEYFKD